jgi:subtilisin family serine protease
MLHRLASLGLLATLAALPAHAGSFVQASAQAEVEPGRYIVRVNTALSGKTAVGALANTLLASYGGKLERTYGTALQGFAVSSTELQAYALAADPRVKDVTPDTVVRLSATQASLPSWGLDRIDQRNLPLNGTYVYDNGGVPVHIYDIDTGLNANHPDFAGRIGTSYNAVPDFGLLLGGAVDCNGHGTHTAGTAMGTSYGVAKRAIIHPVRVFTCAPTTLTSFILDGIDWVTANAQKPAVANMSLGGAANVAQDDAVRAMINSGVVTAIAAGNDAANACTVSPAAVAEGLTVAASERNDASASYTNYGSCVDLYAPGTDIVSADYLTTGSSTLSGTSMAAPHVAGAAALYLARNPNATPAQVGAALLARTTPGKITRVPVATPNKLLYTQP